MQRTYPWLVAILFLGCAVLGAIDLYQRSVIAQAASVREELNKANRRQIADLQHAVATLRDGQAQATKEIAQLKQPAGAARSPNGIKVIHTSDIMKDHPEFAALQTKQARRNVMRQFGDALNSLHLPPDQAAKLKDLLVERQMSHDDAMQVAQAAGLEPGTPAWNEAINQAGQDAENDINTLLGTSAQMTFAQLNTKSNYEAQIQNSYAPDFADAGVALTPDQWNGFVQAMADTATTGKAGDGTVDPATGISPRSQRLLDAASQVLSPAQVQIVKTDLIERNQQQAILSQYTQGGGPIQIVP